MASGDNNECNASEDISSTADDSKAADSSFGSNNYSGKYLIAII